MNSCFLCLGSNFNQIDNFKLAHIKLKQYFRFIYFAKIIETEPHGNITRLALFYNQVALIQTERNIDDLLKIFKCIEKECGRLQDDKQNGIIKMDIDLITFNHQILKEEDLKLEYIKQGIRDLKIQHPNT